jgi:hypothetical protein
MIGKLIKFQKYLIYLLYFRRRRGRRRLLCWDWLVEVVGFWRLAAVCRLSLLVGSRSLARASSHHRAYRQAREPHTEYVGLGLHVLCERITIVGSTTVCPSSCPSTNRHRLSSPDSDRSSFSTTLIQPLKTTLVNYLFIQLINNCNLNPKSLNL